MANISFYGSHNTAFTIEKDGEIICVLELERLSNYKNGGIAQYKTVKDPHITMEILIDWIKRTYEIEEFDNCIINTVTVNMHGESWNLHEMIPHKNVMGVSHHLAHASNAFYQSPYQESLIFSFDGGGDDGKFNIFLADRKNGPTLLESVINPKLDNVHIYYDLGFPYATFGDFLKDIRKEPLTDGNLVYPGKIMGLCSYGNVHEDWLPYFNEYYKENAASGEYVEAINRIIGDKIGIVFSTDEDKRLSDQIAYDVAATAQRSFEDCFLEVAKPYMDRYPNLPICMAGGCGLNIILNTRLKKEFNRDVFVGPNPNDCGISTGLMLHFLKPEKSIDITYKGLPILDYDSLAEHLNTSTNRLVRKIIYNGSSNYPFDAKINFSDIVDEIVAGQIVGVVRGCSEHGPRALGNRSIICNPSFPEMKDILNSKVKNREWYRPFAPVVRLEDVNKYFDWEGESRWMSFCPTVKEEWRSKLSSITHVDGTARVQTVTMEQNPWLYNLLTEFDKKTGVGVLLNTSFNVNGKPILSTLKDAFKIFNETNLDRLIIEDYYFTKKI